MWGLAAACFVAGGVAHAVPAGAPVAVVVALACALAGLPILAAAGLGTLAYVTTTESTLALLFAALERAAPLEAVAARLGAKFLYQSLVGLSLGLALFALYGIHPVF